MNSGTNLLPTVETVTVNISTILLPMYYGMVVAQSAPCCLSIYRIRVYDL